MCGPPDPEMRRAASAKAAPEIAPSEQQRTYTIPVNVQSFIAALLPLSFPFVCVLASCGGSR
jgi:hypothetical protein